ALTPVEEVVARPLVPDVAHADPIERDEASRTSRVADFFDDPDSPFGCHAWCPFSGNRGHHENDLAFKLLQVKENTDLWRRGRDSNPSLVPTSCLDSRSTTKLALLATYRLSLCSL